MVKVFLVLIAVSAPLVVPIQDARSETDTVTQSESAEGAVNASELYKPLLISEFITDPLSQFKKKLLTIINGDTIVVAIADEEGPIARLTVLNKDTYKCDDATSATKPPPGDKKKKKKKGRK